MWARSIRLPQPALAILQVNSADVIAVQLHEVETPQVIL
jgi:hypothetical protein